MKNFSHRRQIQHIHMIGIGGSGMGGIAEVLINLGYQVTGSDISESAMTKRLTGLGANVRFDHHPSNIETADVVVVSTAIDEKNPELIAARQARIPIVKRAEMLAELMRFRFGIAVAGTHGKTTTTSLISSVLAHGGLDPTFVIGGRLNSTGTNARLGESDYFVAEADESDASFLLLQPMISIVTNIDADHMHTYGGDFNRLKQTFIDFLHHLPFYGLAVLCIDDPHVKSILPNVSRPVVTYGFDEEADIRATHFKQTGLKNYFTVQCYGEQAFDIELNIPGKHNALNTLATIAVAVELGVEKTAIREALQEFHGVGRRFQIHDEHIFQNKDVTLIDDYGHHPRELLATIETARQAWPDRRVTMVFQPHRFSRLSELFDDFVQVLSKLDELTLLDVYAAGENPIEGINSTALVQAIGQKLPVELTSKQNLQTTLLEKAQPNDILVMQGAGDIGKIIPDYIQS